MTDDYYSSAGSSAPLEEEEECRVCRGPAEEGYPLYSPCKCSGSIGLTHQDCLASWLQVQRADGRCELCHTKFQFAPHYAEDTPERLPWYEVVLGVSRSVVARWLPWALRFMLALTAWLLLVPLLTTYIYLFWLHTPPKLNERFNWDSVVSDTISGAVIVAVVIISFLSLMSFADFLRFNFRRVNREQGDESNQAEEEPTDDEIDDIAQELNHAANQQRNTNPMGVRRVEPRIRRQRDRLHQLLEGFPGPLDEGQIEERAAALFHANEADRLNEERLAAFLRDAFDDEGNPVPLDDAPHEEGNREGQAAAHDDNRAEPQFQPLDPQGLNQNDAEMNLALDEILGLRGPIGALIRNVMWFMLFIIAYIGIFGYAPRFVGSTVYMRIFKSTNIAGSDVDVHPATSLFDFGLVQLVSELNIETKRLNRALQLNDITMMVLGYMAMALLVAFVQILVAIRMRLYGTDNTEVENQRQEAFRGLGIGRDANEQAPDADADNNFVGIQVNDDAIEIRMTLGQFLSLALDCAGAFVKVGVLLFLKMILLPLILGVWLDAATLSAFGRTSSDRIFHVGNDLFSCLMVHWVVGISFMLLVTVSVLQLREVVHPSLLARTIRPQEPQPDLLGNLLNEGLPTHVKRMILSFTVYAILLLVQIWLPSRILKSLGLDVYIPILRPMLWYIVTPQLQIPLELLVFHLTMLSILEKYKNNIGGTQHVWLVWICRSLGLSDFLLPREVDRFVLVGYKNLFVQIENHNIGSNDDPIQCRSHVSSAMNPDLRFHNQVDPFWYELATHECDQERLIQSKIAHVSPTSEPKYVSVNRKRNGMCTVFGAKDYIRLPQPQSEHEKDGLGNGIPSESKVANVLLPSKMGKYRLRRRRSLSDDGPVIEFFKECQGKLIPRPPEGWDDLGIGGAEVQGRWAWGKESKSLVELGVSERNDFFDKENSMFQLGFLLFRFLLLILLSWVAATILVVLAVSLPLVFGRFFFHALHIPLRFWHDPVAFAIGLIVLFHFLEGATSIRHTVLSPLSWIQELHLPPRRKAATVINATFLWFFAIPCLLGVLYHVMVVKTPEWFTGEDRDVSLTSFFDSWVTGSVLLNAWAFLCVKSVFTKQFWINIGNLIFVVEGEDGNRGRDNGDDNTNEKFCWQGAKKGRIARFFRMLSRALLRNEWDKVDHDVLLAECVYPIATQATLALFLPSMLFAVWLLCLGFLSHENVGMVLPRFGLIFEGVFRQHVFRALTAVTVTVQLFLLSSVQLREWFEVLHKAARDDRYLVGEMLLNYFEDEN